MRFWMSLAVIAYGVVGWVNMASADEAAALRLVPFPKQVEVRPGTFPLDRKLVLEAPAASAKLLGSLVGEELRRAGLHAPEVRSLADSEPVLRLFAEPGDSETIPPYREQAASHYVLHVRPAGVACASGSEEGLAYAVQTLCQLIRANRRGSALPCMAISDWPSLGWRGFMDDMTRGPSATLATLQREVDLGAALKMNLFTYYMEFQFAFQKHPQIGPKDGSLTADELKALVAYAKPRQVDVLGCQQSFGHCGAILSHPEFAACRETADILSPLNEGSYRLLDDLYSDVVPLLPLPWFNVCCDETFGLGTGPSKALAAKIGVGGVYVRHVRRVHDLLRDKYGKRMMMWGDIILQHPDKLDQIPKDTIMLTWAYDPRASFDGQIVPFAKSGYEFFVCPGVDDWSRTLPNFAGATVNIRNFVRDGVKHKTLGMINTEWKDDAETLRSPAWHGYAWGAECAWNASATVPEDFNRRLGGVLFGEKGNHFGEAIALLAKAHAVPLGPADWRGGVTNARFWQNDFAPKAGGAATHASADPLLALVRPAIEHLEACKKDATLNADLLDAFLLGARRMELIGRRMLDGLEAARAYADAVQAAGMDEKLAKLAKAEQLVRRNRDAHEALGQEFARIWRSESKPYALDRTMNRYANVVKWYDDLAARLANARRQAQTGRPLPKPSELGLALPAGNP